MGLPEKIKKIEDDIHRTQVNKKTEHHIGLLRAKLSRLRSEQEEQQSRRVGSKIGYDVRKSGDATVVLIGLPSVGKSTLLNRLTNAKSKVAPYQFTTLEVVPGVMEFNGARIQLLDLPGIIRGASDGKGLGKRVLAVARSADLVLFIVDVFQPEARGILEEELRSTGIRVDEKPPILCEGEWSGMYCYNLSALPHEPRSLPRQRKQVLWNRLPHSNPVFHAIDRPSIRLLSEIVGHRRRANT